MTDVQNVIGGSVVSDLAAELRKPQVCNVNGADILVLSDGGGNWGLSELPVPEPMPQAIQISTLAGVVDYLKKNHDGLKMCELVVQVENPSRVVLKGALTAECMQRPQYLFAQAPEVRALQYGGFMTLEALVIALQVGFVQTDEVKSLLAIVGNVSDSSVKTVADDGVSQQITVKEGAAIVGSKVLPNPVSLRPFRTFREVEQPQSPFIVRLRSGGDDLPMVALFEADGGAWVSTAVESVAQHLREAIAKEGLEVPVLR